MNMDSYDEGVHDLVDDYINKCNTIFNTEDHFDGIQLVRNKIEEYLDSKLQISRSMSYDTYYPKYVKAVETFINIEQYQQYVDKLKGDIDDCGSYYYWQEQYRILEFWKIREQVSKGTLHTRVCESQLDAE